MQIRRHDTWLAGLACLLAALLCACTPERPETGDLGSFFPPDWTAQAGPDIAGDSGEVTALCYSGEKSDNDLSVVGQLFEMSWKNLFPGEYVGNVDVRLMDACGAEVYRFTVPESGSYAFHIPITPAGFDGWFEFPHKPEGMAEEDYPFGGHPLFRQFDKDLKGDYIHVNLRVFGPEILSIPLSIIKQKGEMGYVQGTLYEYITYGTIAEASITPDSGKVWYISDAHLPDANLASTRSRGLFLVANVIPGPVDLLVTLPGGKTITRTVTAWGLDSHPGRVITNVGIPVLPHLLPEGWGR